MQYSQHYYNDSYSPCWFSCISKFFSCLKNTSEMSLNRCCTLWTGMQTNTYKQNELFSN